MLLLRINDVGRFEMRLAVSLKPVYAYVCSLGR